VIGAILWIGGLLAFAVGALLLYEHVIGQIAQAVK